MELTLSKTEGERFLPLGLGRVYLYVQQTQGQGLDEALKAAILNDTAYDTQSEGSRAPWLMALINLTAEPNRFYQVALNALREKPSGETWLNLQWCRMAMQMARQGILGAREALYAKFELQDDETAPWLASNEIIDLDGKKGLRFVLKFRIAQYKRCCKTCDQRTASHIDDDLRHAVYSFGRKRAGKWLKNAARKEADIALAEKIIAQEQYRSRALSRAVKQNPEAYTHPYSLQSLEGILTCVENAEGESPSRYFIFGQKASPEELEIICARLKTETRPSQLLRLLWIFQKRELPPGYETELLAWALHTDERIRQASHNILSHTQSPSVRELALEILAMPEQERALEAFQLFEKNYFLGDELKLEAVLNQITDSEFTHWVSMSILDLFKSFQYPELFKCMSWMYLNTPCSSCRQKCLQALADAQLLPDKWLYESLFDCSEETREWAANLLKQRF
ncbi:MAG: hypothetical protein AB7I41_11655 [Candidatus Sericytochromatia bacterium]